MHSARGFTLIEALIAAAVLGLGMWGVSQLAMHTLQASAANQQQVQALSLALSAVECGRSGPVLCPSASTGGTRQGTVYSVRSDITPTANEKLQAIHVTVTWQPSGSLSSNASGNSLAIGSGQIDLFTRVASIPVFVPQPVP